jgi:hypothetical protein
MASTSLIANRHAGRLAQGGNEYRRHLRAAFLRQFNHSPQKAKRNNVLQFYRRMSADPSTTTFGCLRVHCGRHRRYPPSMTSGCHIHQGKKEPMASRAELPPGVRDAAHACHHLTRSATALQWPARPTALRGHASNGALPIWTRQRKRTVRVERDSSSNRTLLTNDSHVVSKAAMGDDATSKHAIVQQLTTRNIRIVPNASCALQCLDDLKALLPRATSRTFSTQYTMYNVDRFVGAGRGRTAPCAVLCSCHSRHCNLLFMFSPRICEQTPLSR